MPRKKTIAAFEEWAKDDANIEEVLRRVMGGTKLSRLCAEIKRPYTLLYPYLHSTLELQKRYEAALAARADDLMQETLEIADSVRKTKIPARVGAAKVAIETRQALASGWNRERYGETLRVEKTVTHEVDAGLVGTIGDLLRLKRPALTIDQPMALPTPAVEEG